MARQRVYSVRPPTPFEKIDLGLPTEIYVKREDVPPMYAYKWRGAYNRMGTLSAKELKRGVVCASAGNHAQGVAIAANQLGTKADIYMPRPTPHMKQQAVQKMGGSNVCIHLVGDTYDEAAAAGLKASQNDNKTFIHPYNDLETMGGQGTIADEIVMSGQGPFDVVYLAIGGGGMASAVACWLKEYYPNIKIVGVEGVDQASMKAAIDAGGPVDLDYVDIFCDGTAVRKVGQNTFELCRELIDEFITVTNEEVCNAIRHFWIAKRAILEPAGAVGLAGLLKQKEQLTGKKVLTVTCGANIDFSQLAVIAANSGIAGNIRRHIRFHISEEKGSLLDLLENYLEDVSITEFQYGKLDSKEAWPVLGFDTTPEVLAQIHERLDSDNIPYEDLTSHADVDFRIIHYDSQLFSYPWMIHLEFAERPGALADLLQEIKGLANICYFNYRYTGERIGRALIGFEFSSPKHRDEMQNFMANGPFKHAYRELEEKTLQRMLSRV